MFFHFSPFQKVLDQPAQARHHLSTCQSTLGSFAEEHSCIVPYWHASSTLMNWSQICLGTLDVLMMMAKDEQLDMIWIYKETQKHRIFAVLLER